MAEVEEGDVTKRDGLGVQKRAREDLELCEESKVSFGLRLALFGSVFELTVSISQVFHICSHSSMLGNP